MSITSEIERLQSAKNTLKTKLNGINKSTDQITDETLDEYGDYVDTVGTNISTALTTLENDLSGDEIYKSIAVGKGSSITLNDAEEESLDNFKLLGRTIQNGTPSPSNPVAIENVWGKNLAYPSWAQDFVSRINDTSKAYLTTYNSKRCVYFTNNAGYGSYNTKYMFKTNWKSNTSYTISFSIYTSSGDNNMVVEYTDGTTKGWGPSASGSWDAKTLTTDASKTIKYIRGYYTKGNCYINLDTFQIEEGTTQTTYEAGNTVKIKRTDGTSEETYNFPLGDTPLRAGDYIDKLGIHHVREQYVFTGSESGIKKASTASHAGSYYINWGNLGGLQFGSFVCNKARFVTGRSLYEQGCCYSDEDCNLWLGSGTDFPDVTSFKTYLTNQYNAGTPVIIEYYLETPTFTPLTSAQQTVFNEILQDGTYEVVTTYTSEGNLAPDMEISYHKNLQPRLTEIVDEVTDILQ